MNEGDARYHIPVLASESISLLMTDPQGIYVDATLGGGGHSAILLSRLGESGRIIGFDQDIDAIETSHQRFSGDSRMTLIHDNMRSMRPILADQGLGHVDGILMDLGVSSHQLDAGERGFSFREDGPLDMRMDIRQSRSAADLVNDADVDELTAVLREYGEEPQARAIAREVVRRRADAPFTRTEDLTAVVRRVVSPAVISKALARVFQAIRIAVNRELDVLEAVLADAMALLRPGGRLVVISYHSLEDRLVKDFLRHAALTCVCPPRLPVCVCGKRRTMRILTPRPLVPSDAEIAANPRARSAKLRCGERTND